MARFIFCLILLCSELFHAKAEGHGAPAIACVDAQLEQLKVQVGRSFAEMSTQDRAAAIAQLNARFSVLSLELADFLPDQAPQICRLLGLTDDGARSAWPVKMRPFDMRLGAAVSAATQQDITEIISRSLNHLNRTLGANLALPLTIIVGADKANLQTLWNQAHKTEKNRAGFAIAYATSCASSAESGGFASAWVLLICLKEGDLRFRGGRGADAEERRRTGMARLSILHEMVLAAQFQLLGGADPLTADARLAQWGPEWLLEGSANYIAMRTVYTPQSLCAHLAALAEQAALHDRRLEQFETFGAREADIALLYRMGTLAAADLSIRSGDEALARFLPNWGLDMTGGPHSQQHLGLAILIFWRTLAQVSTVLSFPQTFLQGLDNWGKEITDEAPVAGDDVNDSRHAGLQRIACGLCP